MALSICSLRLTCGELGETCYQGNRPPLVEKQYIGLPLGSIHARGWLEEMLLRQASGATGHMDTLYPEVMGKRNGWLGGDGDQWERGPYWIDGLLPLAGRFRARGRTAISARRKIILMSRDCRGTIRPTGGPGWSC